MPSEKTARRATKRYSYNQMAENSAKTSLRAAQQALSGNSQEEAQHAVHQAASLLDRAVKRGAIHANTAARRKSRLTKTLNTLAAAPPVKQRSKAKTTRKTT